MDVPQLLDGRLKMRHLVLVDALSEYGSVIRAAEHLHVTQPVATRALRELEGILGAQLYERGPRGLTPTVFGVAFTEHARTVMGQLRQASKHMADLAGGSSGTVSIGNHLAGSSVLLPQAIARAKEDHPYLTIVVHEGSPDALLADLLVGRHDLVVGRLTPLAEQPRILQQPLYREPIRLVTRVGHPAQALCDHSLPALVDFPWILPITATSLRRELEDSFFRADLTLPRNRVECTSLPTLRELLLATDSIAVLPMLIAHHDPQLAMLRTRLPSQSRSVGVTVPSERHLPPSTRVLLRHLRAVARSIETLIDGSADDPL